MEISNEAKLATLATTSIRTNLFQGLVGMLEGDVQSFPDVAQPDQGPGQSCQTNVVVLLVTLQIYQALLVVLIRQHVVTAAQFLSVKFSSRI